MSNKTSREVRESKIKLISELLDKWQSDDDIIKMLHLSHTTFYRYKQQVYKNDKKLLSKIRTGELEHRQLQVRKALEYCILINKDICDNSTDDKARIESSGMIVKAQMGLLNLATQPHYHDSVRAITKDVTTNIKELENKVLEVSSNEVSKDKDIDSNDN